MSVLRSTLLVLVIAVFAAGCVSTKKRYEKGVELQAEARFAEAADYYVKVLDKDPDYEDARTRLRETGTRAVNDYLDDAYAAERSGQYEEAVAVLRMLDALRDEAQGVRVTLPVPEDYIEYRAQMEQEAIRAVLDQGRAAERAGDWREALKAFERVQADYQPSPYQRASVDSARARVYVKWSEAELANDEYRSAYEQAARAIDILGPDAPGMAAAHEIRRRALEAGTRYVAFLPFSARDEAARRATRGFVFDLNEVLRYEHWDAPPLFISPIDPADVYREVRRYRNDQLSNSEASAVGRLLEADYVVVGELSTFEEEESDLKEERQRVRTKGRSPLDTTFVKENYKLTLKARVDYSILDPRTGATVDRGSADASRTERLDRGRYPGDYRDLDLGRRDLRLFDPEDLEEARREVEKDLIDDLTDRLAQRVYDDLLQRIR